MKEKIIALSAIILLLITGLSGCYENTETDYTSDLPTVDDVQILNHEMNFDSFQDKYKNSV